MHTLTLKPCYKNDDRIGFGLPGMDNDCIITQYNLMLETNDINVVDMVELTHCGNPLQCFYGDALKIKKNNYVISLKLPFAKRTPVHGQQFIEVFLNDKVKSGQLFIIIEEKEETTSFLTQCRYKFPTIKGISTFNFTSKIPIQNLYISHVDKIQVVINNAVIYDNNPLILAYKYGDILDNTYKISMHNLSGNIQITVNTKKESDISIICEIENSLNKELTLEHFPNQCIKYVN